MSSEPLGKSSDVALSTNEGECTGAGCGRAPRKRTDGVVQLGGAPEERGEVRGHGEEKAVVVVVDVVVDCEDAWRARPMCLV